MIGHACFNSKAVVGETVDPCCAPSQNPLCNCGNCQTGLNADGCLNESRLPITRTPCDNVDVEASSAAKEAPLAKSSPILGHSRPSALSLPIESQNHLPISSKKLLPSPSHSCCSNMKKKSENVFSDISSTNVGDIDCSTNYGERDSIIQNT